jgi:hypothetical protein
MSKARERKTKANRYMQIIERIFVERYHEGAQEVRFERDDFVRHAKLLRIKLPKNLGDIPYTFRYRGELPESIRSKAPEGKHWIIRGAGRGWYRFALSDQPEIIPNSLMAETKVPDSTPGVIEMYALDDEQALLAKLRYNRLIDVFTGTACYSLQSHLRTTVQDSGQVETDEIYIGVDRRGAHYVFPVQAKGGKDRLSIVQIEQDFGLCEAKFPSLICRPLAAQFMGDNLIALFDFVKNEEAVRVASERHYRLVPPTELSEEELRAYQLGPE